MTLPEPYPQLTPDELKEAEYNLSRYFEIAFEIVRQQEEGTPKHAIRDREMKT